MSSPLSRFDANVLDHTSPTIDLVIGFYASEGQTGRQRRIVLEIVRLLRIHASIHLLPNM